jgi:phosphate transport system substrate-binding protein
MSYFTKSYFTKSYATKKTAKSTRFLLAFSLGLGLSQIPWPETPLAVAQSTAPPFPLPSSVPSGTSLKLDGSTSMSVVNETFKQRFEEKFAGTQLNLATSTSDEAIQALQDGKIDVAALGRPLTDAEKAQGLKPMVLSREKIAILLGPDNPFQGDISFAQFAQIFRGEITDWAELGGAPGPIRFIDRPNSSDTRISLSRYKVFEDAPFQTGSTAKPVDKDDTATIIGELGQDGISYAIASHALNNAKVRIVPMHKTLPDDPRYPYSQPRNYVYKATADGSVSPAVQAFLGYAGSPDGAKVVQEAQLAEAAAAGAAVAGAAVATATTPPTATPPTDTPPTDTTTADTTTAVPNNTGAVAQAPGVAGSYTPETGQGGFPWGWLLPLALGGAGLLWWLKGRKREAIAPIAEPRELAGVGGRTTARTPEFTGTNPPPAIPNSSSPVGVRGGGATGLGAAGLGAAAAGAGLAGAAAMANKTWNSRLQLTPRPPTEAEASWGWEVGHRDALKQQGGRKSMMRLYDVTDIDPDRQPPNSVRQYDCAENATNMRVPITASDRDYIAELGYVTEDGRWLKGMRSNQVHIPGAPQAAASPTTAIPAAPTSGPGLGGVAAVGAAAVAAGAGAIAARSLITPGNRIGLKAFGERSVYANWDLAPSAMAAAKQQGGKNFQLRVYDTTDIDIAKQPPHNTQAFNCNESKHDKIIAVPHPGRDYVAEVGYAADNNQWLPLARSQALHALNSPAAGLGLAAGAAAATAATSSNWGKTMPAPDSEPKHPDIDRYTIDHSRHSFVLNPEQAQRLSTQSAATQTLEPGHYTLRIKDGTFSYRPLWDHPGEPWVLIWLQGQLTGWRTKARVNSTWLTLNGYQDEYKFQVHAPTRLHAFFVDTNVVDNDGEITLAISRDQ